MYIIKSEYMYIYKGVEEGGVRALGTFPLKVEFSYWLLMASLVYALKYDGYYIRVHL